MMDYIFLPEHQLAAILRSLATRVNSLNIETKTIQVFPKIGVPQNGWFIMENRIKTDDLGGNTPIFGNTHTNTFKSILLWLQPVAAKSRKGELKKISQRHLAGLHPSRFLHLAHASLTRKIPLILLMAEIRRSPVEVGSLSHYFQGFIHPRWLFGISSINSPNGSLPFVIYHHELIWKNDWLPITWAHGVLPPAPSAPRHSKLEATKRCHQLPGR